MQGLMGTMLEKNLQAFAKMQVQMLDPLSTAKGITDAKQLPPELWTQFLSGQPAALHGLMDSYVEQSRSLFEQMQKAGNLFPGMPGFPPKR
jgi:polyhydroxyalkanoate synthesis regulator protein